MDRAEAAATVLVSVVYSPSAGEVEETALVLPIGATLLEALISSGLLERHADIDLGRQRTGVWGRPAPLSTVLRDRDRVEVYRPLCVDPKEARRQRHRRQRTAP